MPRYHLFGDTISIAEHVEAHGVAGAVSISEATKDQLDMDSIAKHSRQASRVKESPSVKTVGRTRTEHTDSGADSGGGWSSSAINTFVRTRTGRGVSKHSVRGSVISTDNDRSSGGAAYASVEMANLREDVLLVGQQPLNPHVSDGSELVLTPQDPLDLAEGRQLRRYLVSWNRKIERRRTTVANRCVITRISLRTLATQRTPIITGSS